MPTIEEYLKWEGHEDQSQAPYDLLLAGKMTEGLAAEHKRAIDELQQYNDKESVRNFYSHCLNAGLSHRLQNGLWERTALTVPKISQHIQPGMKVIDLGCGEGLKTVYYALANPNAQIYGGDIRPEALAAARARRDKYSLANLELIAADNDSLPFCPSFDIAISDHSLHEGTEKYAIDYFGTRLNEMEQALGPGGKAIILLTPHSVDDVAFFLGTIAESLQMEAAFETVTYMRHATKGTDLIMVAKKKR